MDLPARIRRSLFDTILAAGALAAETEYLHAAEFPVRAIRLLVGFAPGSATDTVARLLATALSAHLGVPVVVQNRPGADQMVAIGSLMRSAPDGYTLLMGTGSSLAQNPAMRMGLGYDPLADLTPVGLVAQAVGVLSVAPEVPLDSLDDVIDYARDNPDALAYGSSGVGMANHLAMELLMQTTGTRMAHVPLKSDAEVGIELSAGRVQLGFQTLTSALPLARSGRIRVLAHTHSGALAALPGVPSIGATGIAELNALEPFTFFGVVGPRGLAASLAGRLNAAINACLVSPSMTQRLDGVQLVPVPDDASGFAAHLLAQFAKWREIGRSTSFHD